MQMINRRLLRLALAIQAKLSEPNSGHADVELPSHCWQPCSDLVRKIKRARVHGWQLAAGSLLEDLASSLSLLQGELSAIQQRAKPDGRLAGFSAHEIYNDLASLDEEFDELDFNIRQCQLSVTTESIVLEGVYLGPFEIELTWARLFERDPLPYRIIAKDPHPAESRDNVTHPHVMDELLCEGDGKHAIRRALREGRLLDFFTLVANTLRTYNLSSPFVELALWQANSCSDCGARVCDEESYACQQCGEVICEECESLCRHCEESFCAGCMEVCGACEESFCRACTTVCAACRRRVCGGCLDDQERCTNCHEKPECEDAEKTVGLEVQSHGLGQAALPA